MPPNPWQRIKSWLHIWEKMKDDPKVKELQQANARLDQHLAQAKSDLWKNLENFRDALAERRNLLQKNHRNGDEPKPHLSE